MLTAIRPCGRGKTGRVRWLFKCDCGNETEGFKNNVEHGNKKSCGCIPNNPGLTHGLRYHRLYSIWYSMIRRCSNPNDADYKNYGGRGIHVCDRWKDISNFIADMDESFRKGLSIERIDVNKGYSKDNCKWATPAEQANNKRNNVKIKYMGKIITINDFAKITNQKRSTIYMRKRRGWTDEEIICGTR